MAIFLHLFHLDNSDCIEAQKHGILNEHVNIKQVNCINDENDGGNDVAEIHEEVQFLGAVHVSTPDEEESEGSIIENAQDDLEYHSFLYTPFAFS